MVYIDDLYVYIGGCIHGLLKEPIIGPPKIRDGEICHLQNRHDVVG